MFTLVLVFRVELICVAVLCDQLTTASYSNVYIMTFGDFAVSATAQDGDCLLCFHVGCGVCMRWLALWIQPTSEQMLKCN